MLHTNKGQATLFHALLFYAFATVLVAAALGVIFSRNPVHAVMFLVLTFFQSAVLWLLAEAEFLAIVLVLVYVGAVMVLFLFVVMMLDINVEQVEGGYTRYAPLGIIIAGLMVVELVQVIWLRGRDSVVDGFAPTPDGYSNTEALGAVLYTEHVYAFEIAAVILLLAIVAAITLTMRRRPGLKQQNIARQVATRRSDRVRLVSMKSEKPE
jgi:NADH-quinone oxidoreductase subunit J